MMHRLLPPPSQVSPISVFGRSYSAVPGTSLDVEEGDAGALRANGWIYVARSGTTAQRPSAGAGAIYIDTTLNLVITFDGLVWRDPVTGNAV